MYVMCCYPGDFPKIVLFRCVMCKFLTGCMLLLLLMTTQFAQNINQIGHYLFSPLNPSRGIRGSLKNAESWHKWDWMGLFLFEYMSINMTTTIGEWVAALAIVVENEACFTGACSTNRDFTFHQQPPMHNSGLGFHSSIIAIHWESLAFLPRPEIVFFCSHSPVQISVCEWLSSCVHRLWHAICGNQAEIGSTKGAGTLGRKKLFTMSFWQILRRINCSPKFGGLSVRACSENSEARDLAHF